MLERDRFITYRIRVVWLGLIVSWIALGTAVAVASDEALSRLWKLLKQRFSEEIR